MTHPLYCPPRTIDPIIPTIMPPIIPLYWDNPDIDEDDEPQEPTIQ